MSFEHARSTAWSRFLTAIDAARPPNIKVRGQDIEDSLRAVVLAHDVRNMSEPLNYAFAGVRIDSAAGAAGTVSRMELQCLSPGGLWLDPRMTFSQIVQFSVIDLPVSVMTRAGIVDFGNVPTVSTIGTSQPLEAVPPITEPRFESASFQTQNPTGGTQWYIPPGKVLLIRRSAQASGFNVSALYWREIPAPIP